MKARAPFSIVHRMIALVAAVSVLSVLLYALALAAVLRPFMLDFATRLTGQIVSIEQGLRAVPPAARDAFAASVRSPWVSVGRSPPRPAKQTQGGELLGVPDGLIRRLEADLGRPVQLLAGPEIGGRFEISFDMRADGETWWLTLASARPSIGWTLAPIFGSIALIGIAAGLTLVVGVRFITEPMSTLAQNLLARGSRLSTLDEPPRSSIELQGVIRSFNAMVAAVEAAERSRHDLLAGVSHDLRTPLARLRLRAETQCPPEVADKMDVDFVAVSRIIDQFLAYAQGQGESADLARFPLPELVSAVVARYRDDGLDIALTVGPHTAAAFPEIGLQRALVNLIDNARTHGKAPFEVELAGTPSEVGLTVFDAGTGIRAESFVHALKPFVRLDPQTSRDGHCGLGLAIVAQIAERLGGRTVLHPFDGRRSGVGIRLPVPPVA